MIRTIEAWSMDDVLEADFGTDCQQIAMFDQYFGGQP